MKEKYDYYNTIEYDYNNFESLYQKDAIKEMETADLRIHIGGDNYCYGVNEWMCALNKKAKQLCKKIFDAIISDLIYTKTDFSDIY